MMEGEKTISGSLRRRHTGVTALLGEDGWASREFPSGWEKVLNDRMDISCVSCEAEQT